MQKIRLGKKGDGSSWMTEEVGKTILAVAVIVLLALFLYTVGKAFFANTHYQQAKSTLDDLANTVNNMEDNSLQPFIIESPKGWMIIKQKEGICICSPNDFTTQGICDTNSKTTICQDLRDIQIPNDGCIDFSGFVGLKNTLPKSINCIYIKSVPAEIYLSKIGKTTQKVYLAKNKTLVEWWLPQSTKKPNGNEDMLIFADISKKNLGDFCFDSEGERYGYSPCMEYCTGKPNRNPSCIKR